MSAGNAGLEMPWKMRAIARAPSLVRVSRCCCCTNTRMSEGSEARSRLANHEEGAVEATEDEARKEKLVKEAVSSGTGAVDEDDEDEDEDVDEEEDGRDWPRRKRRNSASSSHVK